MHAFFRFVIYLGTYRDYRDLIMENKAIYHLCHKHPLILTEIKGSLDCYGCDNPVVDLEMAYICMKQHCRNKTTLHKKCGELPSRIWLPKHFHNHPLDLFDFHQVKGHRCDVCRCDLENSLGYRCSDCDFDIDIACKKIGINALFEEERKQLQHPSHPDHPLTLMRKPATMFNCDGCGAEDVDMAYICSSCEFWVHKNCALLPFTRQYPHHHHDLSLAFSFPKEHRDYYHRCEVCDKHFDSTCWVYFCGDCRYFVHLKCVGSTTQRDDSKLNDNNDGSDGVMIEFPLHAHDTSKELITRFVMREKGLGSIPDEKEIARDSFSINYHEHPLSLVLESFHKEEEEEDSDDGDGDDEEEEDDELKICEACVTPISSPPYYKCVSCRYSIHLICYLLPKTLCSSSSPDFVHHLQLLGGCQETPNKNHNFTLYASSKSIDKEVIMYECDLCGLSTNGMGYKCGDCSMKIDVKCASLPTTIRHAFHSHHHHKSLILTQHQGGRRKECRACLGTLDNDDIAYCCSSDDCDFASHLKCTLTPLSVRKADWDKHPLLLTFDASLDHPSEFFCGFCELKIHPKSCMYHCRQCDNSFHMDCLEAASGVYRNVKFGGRFQMDDIHPHPHPLTFNYVTLKKRCDICSEDVFSRLGFECAACYYVVCLCCSKIVFFS